MLHMPVFSSKKMTLTEERVRKLYKLFRKRRRLALKNERVTGEVFQVDISFFYPMGTAIVVRKFNCRTWPSHCLSLVDFK